MENAIAEYAKQQEDICKRNDTIAPCLYEEYGHNDVER